MDRYIPILIVIVQCILSTVGQSQPFLQLFNHPPPNDTFVVTLKASTPNLPPELLGTNYYCFTGVWIVYWKLVKDYTDDGEIFETPRCESYNGNYAPYQSAWLVESSKNTSIPTINLFSGEWWSNPTTSSIFTENQPSYSGIFNSVAVTGSTAVTFYTDFLYQGRSFCLQPFPGYTIPFIGDLEFLGSVTPGEIKSFRFGCFGTNIIYSKQTSLH